MTGSLGFGSEDLTGNKKATGHGVMEASGTSHSGLIYQRSNQMVTHIRTVSRYITTILLKMDGMTIPAHLFTCSSAAGEFAKVAFPI